MPESPQIVIERRRPLGAGWPAITRWRVKGEDEIDGVELGETRRPERYALAHRTVSGPPRWQVTWFDPDGAGGDIRRSTLEEALNEGAPAAEYVVTALHLKSDRSSPRGNPSMAHPTKAISAFKRFHTRDWRGEGDFHPSLEIPSQMHCLGPALNTLYSSDKLNPTTGEDEGWIEYIHEHSTGVHVYVPAKASDDNVVVVPSWIRNTTQLTWLGRSLGFEYRDDAGASREVKGTRPLPELYCTPDPRRAALLIIQNKRTLLAILWGGKLRVERRGIVH